MPATRRTAPFQCMGGDVSRKKKRKHEVRGSAGGIPADLPSLSWMGKDGLHMVAPGLPPKPEELSRMTEQYQEQIRNSPIWYEMVRQFGQEKAEELLKEFRVDLG
jgi:hypothetical protein